MLATHEGCDEDVNFKEPCCLYMKTIKELRDIHESVSVLCIVVLP